MHKQRSQREKKISTCRFIYMMIQRSAQNSTFCDFQKQREIVGHPNNSCNFKKFSKEPFIFNRKRQNICNAMKKDVFKAEVGKINHTYKNTKEKTSFCGDKRHRSCQHGSRQDTEVTNKICCVHMSQLSNGVPFAQVRSL